MIEILDNITVEVRKMFRRKEVYYISLGLISFILGFIYLISKDSPNIMILNNNMGQFTSTNFIEIIFIIMQESILFLIVAIISWNVLGKERDDLSDFTYILLSRNLYQFMFAKIFILNILIIYFGFLIIMFSTIGISYFRPEIIINDLHIKHILLSFLAYYSLGLFYLLLGFLLSLYKGSIGVLLGTIFTPIIFVVLKNYTSYTKYLPNVLMNYKIDDNLILNFSLMSVYIVLIVILLLYSLNKRKFFD